MTGPRKWNILRDMRKNIFADCTQVYPPSLKSGGTEDTVFHSWSQKPERVSLQKHHLTLLKGLPVTGNIIHGRNSKNDVDYVR